VAASTIITVRASKRLLDLIDRGAAAANKTRAVFMLEASAAAAQNALVEQTYFALSPTQMTEFKRLMDEPLSDNKAVANLLTRRAPWER
jgi:uncharacterized protein (DUF1778 family)